MRHQPKALLAALALYLAWTGATWLLEGRIETLLRPEAVAARANYAVVANILLGTVAAALVLRLNLGWRLGTPAASGFGPASRAAIAIPAGLLLGGTLYILQGGPTEHPALLLNAFAQVLVVSVAEVLVCWAVVGATLEAVLRPYGRLPALLAATMAASVVFGLYHFAHSPPFNMPGMVALLTAVGLLTSAFFFVSRDIYGTIAFHNFLGTLGVAAALESREALETYATLRPALLAMALVALAVLIVSDRLLVRGR